MYKVVIDKPNLAEGATIELDGLGIFANGGTYEVSDEEAATFRTRHSTTISRHDKRGRLVQRIVEGPDLITAFDNDEGVTIEYVKEPSNA